MIPVERGVNRIIAEGHATPWSGRDVLARTRIVPARRRASVGTERLVTQRNKGFVQMHNLPNRECWFASIAYRAYTHGKVAAGFVRRSCFSLKLVCRTRLDRDVRIWGRIRVT